MRTPQQIEASRINGAKSRGPATPEGKQAAARNSTRHGLCSRDVVLTNEDSEAWESLRNSFQQRWNPIDDVEILLIDELAACQWKLLRAESLETALLNVEMDILEPEIERTFKSIDETARQAVCIKSLVDNSAVLAQLDRHQTRLSRQFDRTWKRLDQLKKERPAPKIEIVQDEPELPPVVMGMLVQNEPEPGPAPVEHSLQNEPEPVAAGAIQPRVQNQPELNQDQETNVDESDEDPRIAVIDRILSRFPGRS